MHEVAGRREEIYDYFHQSHSCQQFFCDPAQEERYAAYYTSMYLLQDTTESLFTHRERKFSSDPHQAYIEFWGVMQALVIQQDSIAELYEAVVGTSLDTLTLKSWQSLRQLRNTCAGHPSRKDRPKTSRLTRSFMGRGFGGYSQFTYEQWEAPDNVTQPRVMLGALIDEYAKEAEGQLVKVLQSMKQQWQT